MKINLISIPLLILVLVLTVSITPALGMKALTESEMDRTIASYGVDLYFDDYRQYLEFGQFSSIDTDGLQSQSGDQAALNINSMEFDLFRADMLLSGEAYEPHTVDEDGDFHYPPSYQAEFHKDGDGNISPHHDTNQINRFESKGLTIDIVDELPAMSAASNYANSGNPNSDSANVAGVYIGLPTMEFFVDEFEIDSITMSSDTTNIANSGKSFGHLEAFNVQMDKLDGYLEFAPHKGTGFDIMVDDVVMFSKIDSFTYYDEDGDPSDNTRENFEIRNFKIDALRVDAITHLDSSGNPASVEMGDSNSVPNQIHMTAGNEKNRLNSGQADNYDFQNGDWQYQQPLSIDVTNKLPAMSAMEPAGDVVGMHIGLPTAELYIDNLDMDLYTGSENKVEVLGVDLAFLSDGGKKYGHINLSGFDLAFLEGALELSAHGETGIDLAVDDVVAYMSFEKLSFDDGYTSGYGEAGLEINNFEMDMLRMNAIAQNSGGLYSPGDNPPNGELYFQQNSYGNLDPSANSFEPSPLRIDFTSKLQKMSQHKGGNIAGVSMRLPTMEMYADQIGIRSIALHDPDGGADNEHHPFSSVRIKGASRSILGGGVEIAPH